MNYYKLLLLGLLFSTSVFAQSLKEKGLLHIERDYAESVIGFLASDAMRGRKAGSNEGKIAGEYLVAALKELKIVPLYGDYMQPFSIFKEDSLSSRYVHADQLPTQDVYAQLNLANVLGMIEGEKKDEYVIVGAHYDHLGVDHRFVSDSIYNGADDNASGVSAVLQLARAFKQSGKKPNRTLIFAFWDGEEIGLMGSSYFIKQFGSLSSIKAYLNFDMIGRNHQETVPEQHAFIYTASHPLFKEWLNEFISTYQLQLKPDYQPLEKPVTGSDNASFARHDIPILWYHTDGHSDYHMPTDHIEKINWSKLVDITKAAYLHLWNLAEEADY